jgi:hypothetical protein
MSSYDFYNATLSKQEYDHRCTQGEQNARQSAGRSSVSAWWETLAQKASGMFSGNEDRPVATEADTLRPEQA